MTFVKFYSASLACVNTYPDIQLGGTYAAVRYARFGYCHRIKAGIRDLGPYPRSAEANIQIPYHCS